MIFFMKMGGTCCKKLDSPTSPHLPFCEVIRRCARQICPLDPPVQKTIPRARKYGLSDIVGPVVKKDSWAQTDPLPPPRRRRRKGKEKRRKSKSLELLPQLLKESVGSTGSLRDITGQEDAIDFEMYLLSRLPPRSDTTEDDGKETLTGRKKEFLSGLLGEENNNLTFIRKSLSEGDKSFTPDQSTKQGLTLDSTNTETSSRRSSISESLKEFESSLLDMLQDVGEEEDDAGSTHLEDQTLHPLQLKTAEGELSTVKEEREEDYVLTPLEEEDEDAIEKADKLTVNCGSEAKDKCEIAPFDGEDGKSETKTIHDEDNYFKDRCLRNEKQEECKKQGPPIITIETIS